MMLRLFYIRKEEVATILAAADWAVLSGPLTAAAVPVYIPPIPSSMMCHRPIMPISSCSTMWQWNMDMPG